MPQYAYTAKTGPHKTIQGNIEAESDQDAINKLNHMGYFPVSVHAQDIALDKQGTLRFWKNSAKDIAMFTRQFATLTESGVNIINGLNIILNQTSHKYLKTVLSDIIAKIKDGKPLSKSLAGYPYLFSNLYISMVHSGEISGNLDDVLKRMSDFLEKEQEFKDSIRTALTYPIFVLCVGILTIIVLLGFVIPKLTTMFEDMGQILPLPTRILIAISNFLHSYGWSILAAVIIAIFWLQRVKRSPQGRIKFDTTMLKMAIWGEIILKTEISRLMRTLSLLLSSGISVMYSLNISITILENQALKLEVEKFKDKINKGLSFSDCLRESKLFPSLVTDIVVAGEETGNMEKSLLRIADEYEKDVDRTLKTFTRMLEPVIILITGLVVGFIVLSMLLPIFQINLIVR
ncbi:MAG: type II secretion system F family protein [Candidatus Omnitrophota bacterium]